MLSDPARLVLPRSCRSVRAARLAFHQLGRSCRTVYVELPESKGGREYVAGRFAVTTVDPDGKAHEAVVVQNLAVIDRVSTSSAAARANGFIPLQDLGKRQRYAEVLGHELAHAEWTFADPDRARLARPFSGGMAELVGESRRNGSEVERISRQVEEHAEAAEKVIWAELAAGERAR